MSVLDRYRTQVIIIAAGEQTRWEDYHSTPKHLIDVLGEPLLHRTVRQVRTLAPEKTDIVVVGLDERYKVDGAELHIPTKNPEHFDADKFLNSRQFWAWPGRTVVLYGDVFFTDEALMQILRCEKREWLLWARPFASRLTGTQWGECFAQSWWWDDTHLHDAALRRIVDLYQRGIISRCGGWEHYRAMIGLPDDLMNRQLFGGKIEIIDDFTEDFDYPYDYERWKERYEAAHDK